MSETERAVFMSRDLWLESRNYTSQLQERWITSFPSKVARFFRPGNYPPLMPFGGDSSVMCVDLNKYRPDINVELLIDQGVRVFMLRVGGPTVWMYSNEKYEVDFTFVPYYERIRAYAKKKGVVVWIVGYAVHNYWANEINNYNGPDYQVKWLKEATRNHECDAYCWDDEVDHTWKDNKDTYITATNAIKSIAGCMEQTFQEMERNLDGSYKMVVHYSANWFMKKVNQAGYAVWLDNNNSNILTRHMTTWRAWVPNIFTEVFATLGDLFTKVLTPTGIQENAYLVLGSGLKSDFWQFSFTAMGPWCPTDPATGKPKYGIDVSTSYGPSATLSQMAYCHNWQLVLPDTEPPTVPSNLSGYVSGGVVALKWDASTDNVGVDGYVVFRDGVKLVSLVVLGYTDKEALVGVHTYSVTAFDRAGNVSAPATETVEVPTLPPPPPGTFLTVEEFNNWTSGVYDLHTHNTGRPV